jgi:predicted nucleic acid-binding protein
MTQARTLILVDTNIWVDHFASANKYLKELLESERVVTHPFVTAELALGSLPDRMVTMALLEALPELPVAELEEVRELIEVRSLYGKGIGFVDAHLLASLLIAAVPTEIWTDDRNLADSARRLGVLARPPFIE